MRKLPIKSKQGVILYDFYVANVVFFLRGIVNKEKICFCSILKLLFTQVPRVNPLGAPKYVKFSYASLIGSCHNLQHLIAFFTFLCVFFLSFFISGALFLVSAFEKRTGN